MCGKALGPDPQVYECRQAVTAGAPGLAEIPEKLTAV